MNYTLYALYLLTSGVGILTPDHVQMNFTPPMVQYISGYATARECNEARLALIKTQRQPGQTGVCLPVILRSVK